MAKSAFIVCLHLFKTPVQGRRRYSVSASASRSPFLGNNADAPVSQRILDWKPRAHILLLGTTNIFQLLEQMHVCCSQRQRSPVRVTRVGTLLNILTIGREALERRVGNILTGEEEVVDDLLCKEWVVGDHWSLFTHICSAADGHREGKENVRRMRSIEEGC